MLAFLGTCVILTNMETSTSPVELDWETPVAAFIRREGVSAYELARRVGTSYKQLCNWRDGRALPGLVNAFRMERVTQGKIPAAAWLGTVLGRKQWEQHSNWDNWQTQRRKASQRARDRAAGDGDGDIRVGAQAAPAATPGEAILVIPSRET